MRWSERSIKSRLGRLSVAAFVVAVAIRFIHLHPAALSLLVLGVLAIFAWVWFLRCPRCGQRVFRDTLRTRLLSRCPQCGLSFEESWRD
jgi:hypothetical protein